SAHAPGIAIAHRIAVDLGRVQVQEHVRQHAQSAVARRVVVLVAEDGGVNLGLGRVLDQFHLLLGLSGQIHLEHLDVFLDARQDLGSHLRQQLDSAAVSVTILAILIVVFSHISPCSAGISPAFRPRWNCFAPSTYTGKYAPGSLNWLGWPLGQEYRCDVSTRICPSGATSMCARSMGRGAGPSKLTPSSS